MDLVKRICFLLALISSVRLGDGCSLDPSIVKCSGNASILQGNNHTFWCRGTGSNFIINWEINGIPTHELPKDSNLEVVNVDIMYYNDGCTKESMMIVHAKSVPENNTLSTFAIQCVIKPDLIAPVVAEAYLEVHVINGAGDVELISPASPERPAIVQWKAPDVLSGSSSPLYYNITVRDPSNQIIAQNTTTDTFFAIDSNLLVLCDPYELTLLPFQYTSAHPELGLMTQEILLPPPLPPTNVNLSVCVQHDSASVIIYFQPQLSACSLQCPENFQVMVMQHGPNADEIVESVKGTALQGMENKYTLEKLPLRQKYQVSIKLETIISSSVVEIVNVSTFNVQNLTLTKQEDSHELNVHCDMAKGAEDKNCTVMMRNETGVLQQNCFPTGGRDATCKLSGLASGQYMIQGYDKEWEEIPALEHAYFLNKELKKDLTNTPTSSTDDTTTMESSSRFVEDEETVQNDLIVVIVALLIFFFLIVGLVSIIVAIVVMKFHRKKRKDYDLRDTEAAHTEVHVYPMAEENEYDGQNIPQQQDTLTVSTVVQERAYAEAQTPIEGNAYDEHGLPGQLSAATDSTDVQEPAYADAQIVISTTNSSHDQYRKLRKEQLVPDDMLEAEKGGHWRPTV